MFAFVLVAVALTVLLGPFVAMTAQGAQRRGNGAWVVAVSGLFFPVTWVVWYLRDEHPYARQTQ
jgi:ammonia channel protein AmtB